MLVVSILFLGFLCSGNFGGCIGIMEKKMEATSQGLGFRKIRGIFSLGVPIRRTI